MKPFLLSVFTAITLFSTAQSNRLVQAVVQTAQYTQPGEWRLTVDKPEGFVARENSGFVVGRYEIGNPYRNLPIGYISTQTVQEKTVDITTSTYDDLQKGDVVIFEIPLPETNSFKGILYKLAVRGIFPVQADATPYFTISQVSGGNKAWEDQTLSKILADVKGITATATPQTLLAFLTAMEKVPQVFWGRNLNLANEYADWIKSGAMDYSLIDSFVKVLDKPADFETLKKTHAGKLTRDFLINTTNGVNIAFSGLADSDGYYKSLQAIEKLLPGGLTGDDLGFLHFQSGSARLSAKLYAESAKQYALAAKAFKNQNAIQYARAITREAEAHENVGNYSKSMEMFKQSAELWRELVKKQPNHYNTSRLITGLEGVTVAASELEDHDLYIATYVELLPLYGRLKQKLQRGNAYWNIGYTYGSKKKIAEASNENYERAYEVFDSLKNVKNAVIVLCNQAINHRGQKNYRKAVELGQRAEAYAQANLNAEYEGYALNNIYDTYTDQKNNVKALEVARKLEKIYTTLNMPEKLATIYDNMATLYTDMEKPQDAANATRQALKLYQTFARDKELADAYWNAGYYTANVPEAISESNNYYQKAFDYYKDHKPTSATSLLSNMAINHRDANDSTNAYQQHWVAVKYANNSNDTAAIINAHEKFYHSYSHFGDYKKMAREGALVGSLHKSQKNQEKATDYYKKAAAAIDSLIKFSNNEKDYTKSARLSEQQIKIYEQAEDAGLTAQATFYAGYYISISEDKQAARLGIKRLKKAQSMYEKLDDYHKAVIYVNNEIAKLYKNENNLDSALIEYDRAIAYGEKHEQWENLSLAYEGKAKVLADQKKYDGANGAIASYEKAIATAIKIPSVEKENSYKKSLASLMNDLKRYEDAARQHMERLKKTDPNDDWAMADVYWDYAYSLSNVSKRIKESNEYYEKAAAIYKKGGYNENYAMVVSNIGFNYRDMNDSVSAYKTYRNLIKYLEGTANGDYKTKNLAYAKEKYGYALKHFGHHTQAMKTRLQAAEGYQSIKNFEKAYSLYEETGKSADAAKRYMEAEKYFRQSLAMAETLGDKSKKANAIWNIAYNKGTYQKKYKDALPMWEEAYTLFLEAGDTANASVMRSNVGQEMWTLYDFDKAIENHLKAIDIATKGKYLSQVAYSWRKLADLYNKTENVVKESEAMTKAIETLEILKDSTELLTSYFDVANSLSNAQETTKADSYLSRALKLAMAKKDSTNIAWAYYKFGGLYYTKDQDKANKYYELAAPIQKKLGDKANLIYTIASHGSMLMERDRPRSEKMLNDAITMATELKDDNILAYCHSRLYDLYRSFGKPDIAHEHWETSTKLYQKSEDQVLVTNNYISIANEYLYDYGDFTKAQEYMAKAKALLGTINNPLTNAYFHGQQCDIYADQGQYDLALAELDQSSEIYKKLKNDWGLAGNYIEYGNIYRSLSEYARALKYQSMSDSLYHALHLEYQRLAPVANIGDVYFDQGDYPKALEYFKRSLKYMEDNKDQNTNICKLYSAVGITYNNMTQYDEAEKWMLKGIDVSNRIHATRVHADILNMLGKLKIETKKFDEADKYLSEAKTFLLSQKLMVERTTNATHMGHLYVKKGDLPKAKTELSEAIELGEKFGKDGILWEAYFRMGQYYRKSGDLKEGKNYLMKSVSVIEKMRNNVVGGEEAKKLFSSDKWIMEAYEELISVLLELGETEEAMAWLQKINENNVRDKMRSMDVTFEDDAKNKALAQEKEMKMKLEALEKQIAAQKQAKVQNAEQLKQLENIRTVAESDYLKFVNQQVNVQPELSKYFSNTVQPSQLKGKKKQIPKDMALVSYLVGEKQLYIFVATSDTVVARIVAVSKEKIHRDVNAMINITKGHLGNFGKVELASQEAERKEIVKVSKQADQVLKPFEDSYHYLISPIGELITNKTKLGIIATGELNYIPFQLLGKTLSNGKFSLLINQFALFYTNSTDMLLRVAPEAKNINILAFGNPDKTLPATEKEVKDIQTIFPSTKVYLREEATEDRAKYAPEEFNVMHFATHGNLDYEDFSKSYLTMAGNNAKNEDGMLTLEELWGMEVMSHLNIVVLSACQTAVTKGSDESSPVSPASGFLQNGVKSVVATLWKVDDEATSILMNDFYTNIKTMDAVDAMRHAQSKLASNPKFAHPYYWAAMVLIGDWR